MAAVTLLSTESLCRSFGGLKAVDDVAFTVAEGEIRALIGPNGAGKSTLVGLIAGRMPPSAGRIMFAGEDVSSLPAHRRVARGIAYTFQITSIFGNLSVFDNVALAAQNSLQRHASPWRLLDQAKLEGRTIDALASVGLSEQRNAFAAELPYGHQRLVEVAMGLALEPRLLILDEPTQGLSDAEIEAFCGLVREIALNATILLIEHNMDVVMQLADSVTVMAAGRILADGTPDAIKADPVVQAAYLGA